MECMKAFFHICGTFLIRVQFNIIFHIDQEFLFLLVFYLYSSHVYIVDFITVPADLRDNSCFEALTVLFSVSV